MARVTCSKGCKTTYHGATDHHGARITATNLTSGRKITSNWDDGLDSLENHTKVATELLEVHTLLAVSIKNGGYVFVVQY